MFYRSGVRVGAVSKSVSRHGQSNSTSDGALESGASRPGCPDVTQTIPFRNTTVKVTGTWEPEWPLSVDEDYLVVVVTWKFFHVPIAPCPKIRSDVGMETRRSGRELC